MAIQHKLVSAVAATGLLAVLANPAQAAFRINDLSVDGNWLSKDLRASGNSGNSIGFDYTKLSSTSGVLGVAPFLNTVRDSGEETDIWLSGAALVNELDFSATADLFMTFDGDHRGGNNPSTVRPVGQVTIMWYSCNLASVSYDFDEGSADVQEYNLEDTDWEMVVPQFDQTAAQCPYQYLPPSFADTMGLTDELTDDSEECTGQDLGNRVCLHTGGTISEDTTWGNFYTHVLEGEVAVGVDEGGAVSDSGVALTVKEGAYISNTGQASDYLMVRRGNKMYGIGSQYFPIIFSSTQPTPGSIGGVVLLGRSVVNGCSQGTQLCEAAFEALPSELFGGNNFYDNSGAMKYWQIRWAGLETAADKELNSLTLLGVGRGTYISHVQVVGGQDDGFEMFGGSVNMANTICSGAGDECYDTDLGYRGVMNNFLAIHDGNITTGGEGTENSNNPDNLAATPITKVVYANGAFINRNGGTDGRGVRYKEGGNIELFNVIISGFDRAIAFTDGQNYVHAGPLNNPTGDATANHVVLVGNTTNFDDDSDATFALADWFAQQEGNMILEDAMMDEDGFPMAGSPLLGAGGSSELMASELNDADNNQQVDYVYPNPNIGWMGSRVDFEGWTWGINESGQ